MKNREHHHLKDIKPSLSDNFNPYHNYVLQVHGHAFDDLHLWPAVNINSTFTHNSKSVAMNWNHSLFFVDHALH